MLHVYTSMYWYVLVCTCMYRYVLIYTCIPPHACTASARMEWNFSSLFRPNQVRSLHRHWQTLQQHVQDVETSVFLLLYPFHKLFYCQASLQKIPRLLHREWDPLPHCLPGQQEQDSWQCCDANRETLSRILRVKKCTDQYIPVCTGMYWYILLMIGRRCSVCTGTYAYIPVHTSTYTS